MADDEIRLQYAGFVIFAAKMLSVATGFLFQLMIVRTTTIEEYGIWFNLNDILGYFTLLAAVLPFWTMRFVARGKERAVKTGLLVNMMISVVAVVIYLPFVPLLTSLLGIGQEYLLLYFLLALQIIELYSLNSLIACLRAKKPQVIGYGLLIGEGFKVILGYVFIMRFQQPLLGALISLTTSMAVQTFYYLQLLKEPLRQRVSWEYAKEWLKGSVANIYNIAGGQLVAFIFIMLFTYGGREARGVFGAATLLSSIITYSMFLAFALYPRLLAEKNSQDITISLKMVLMFAIPMTVGAIVLSDSYMIIMKDTYKDAWPVLIVLAIDGFVITLSGLFSTVLWGVERVDEQARISFSELVRSRLFFVFSLPYLHSLISLPTASYVLGTYAQNQPLMAALYVSIINSSARLAMFLVMYAVVRKMVTIDIPWRNIGKYVSASAAMATLLFIIPHPTRIYLTLIATVFGGSVYFILLVAIDKEARYLVKSVWQEIRSKFKGA